MSNRGKRQLKRTGILTLFWISALPAGLATIVIAIVGVLFVYSKFPDRMSSASATKMISRSTPIHFSKFVEVEYARRYWQREKEPGSACIVIQLHEQALLDMAEHKSLDRANQKEVNLPGRGCDAFRSKMSPQSLSKLNLYSLKRDVSGYAIYVDDDEEIALFELYSHD